MIAVLDRQRKTVFIVSPKRPGIVIVEVSGEKRNYYDRYRAVKVSSQIMYYGRKACPAVQP